MVTLKKLIFAPFFLIVFSLLIYNFSPILKSSDFIFSLSPDTLIQLMVLSLLIFLSSFLFVLFISLASDWRLVVPVVIISCLIPLIFVNPALAVVFAVGILVSLLLSFLTLPPPTLLGPAIKHLSTLLILVFGVVYFLSINTMIAQEGFQIPDSLIDTTLQFTQPKTNQEQSANPQISIPQNLTNDLLKQTIKDQLQALIKPYSSLIPAILAVLLFFTLQSLISIINLLISPLLWITFYILEKSGFIKFTTEMRPVKKMVI